MMFLSNNCKLLSAACEILNKIECATGSSLWGLQEQKHNLVYRMNLLLAIKYLHSKVKEGVVNERVEEANVENPMLINFPYQRTRGEKVLKSIRSLKTITYNQKLYFKKLSSQMNLT